MGPENIHSSSLQNASGFLVAQNEGDASNQRTKCFVATMNRFKKFDQVGPSQANKMIQAATCGSKQNKFSWIQFKTQMRKYIESTLKDKQVEAVEDEKLYSSKSAELFHGGT